MGNFISDDFVTPEIGKKLKGIGFNVACFAYFTDDNTLLFSKDGHGYASKNTNSEFGTSFSSPTWTSVFDWLDKKGLHCMVSWNQMSGKYFAGIIISAKALIPIDGFPVFDERYDANVAVVEQAVKSLIIK